MAEKQWRESLPKMGAELETKGRRPEMLLVAVEKTVVEFNRFRRQ